MVTDNRCDVLISILWPKMPLYWHDKRLLIARARSTTEEFCASGLSNLQVFPNRLAVHAVTIVANSFNPDDDLSTAFGPEALAERDMVPEGFDNTTRPSPVERWEFGR
jgi:hypothetical protein